MDDMGERVLAGTRAVRFLGSAELPNYLRQAYGPGRALIGDSLYFKDPAPADGISDAFRAADLFADALDDILSGRTDEENGLARFQERNDKYAVPLLDLAANVASFDNTPQQRVEAFFGIRLSNEEEVAEVLETPESRRLNTAALIH